MRSFVRPVLVLVVILLAAWIGLWWYAQGRMQAGITNWANKISDNPQMKVSYDSMARGGSPLAATVTLTNLRITYQPLSSDGALSATLPSFTMRINAGSPLLVHYDLPDRINLGSSRGGVSVTFGSIAATQHLDPNALFNAKVPPFKSNDVAANDINVLAEGSLMVLHADTFTAHGVENQNAKAGQIALAVTEDFNGFALSPLLTRLGSVPFGGKIAHLGFNMNLTGPVPANLAAIRQQFDALPSGDTAAQKKIIYTTIQDWAAQGGSAAAGIALTVGPTTLNAAGSVTFDANVQPQGKAAIIADHIDAFTAALTQAYPGLQGDVTLFQAQASPYLSASDANGQVLKMQVAYGNGAVNINGQKVTDMKKLDWNALENPAAPPPPPAQAPGDGSGAASP